MSYAPFNYEQINIGAGTYNPSPVKAYNNATFNYWERSLFQRACSVFEWTLPDEWQGNVKDFFLWCLFKYGFVIITETDELGTIFQPATLSGYNVYYQPINALISNPLIPADKSTLRIGADCEILKLTPDYFGVWDTINYYAEKLSSLDNAINMSIINNKVAYVMGARNKAAAEALKKVVDKVNKGEPTVIIDSILQNDRNDKDVPFQIFERKGLKESYITSEQLQDFQTLLNNYDAEIGIPTIPYAKKERMVTSEADSRIIDATSKSLVWLETLKSCIEKINAHYNLNLNVELRFAPGGESYGDSVNNGDV